MNINSFVIQGFKIALLVSPDFPYFFPNTAVVLSDVSTAES
jgi:hypothetical protein